MFNSEAAAKVYDLVCGMDDASAEVFVKMAAFDILMADIAANRRTVERHIEAVHKRLADRVSKVFVTGYDPERPDTFLGAAAAVAAVSKARKNDWDPDEHPRGEHGLFRMKNKGSSEVSFTFNRKKGPADFNLTSALNGAGPKVSAFEQEWNRNDRERSSTNRATYDRIAAGSKVLGGVPNAKAKAAGQLGSFVGQYGPEAEKVVGPSLRRAAYRYRGTERPVDRELIQAANTYARVYMKNDGVTTLSEPDRQRVARVASIKYLQDQLPLTTLRELQMKAGKVPPSQGVIINSEGKIITQAVGYGDDHYLPFNLRNLKGLQGGQYVRSRAQGGLTTEDIYTGLVSGARSVTVISHTGIFTVNFDEAFRGSRRYNDKAAQMVSRYGKLLDAVQSQQINRRSLTPEERTDIRDEVEEEMKHGGFTRSEIEDQVKRKTDEYRSVPQLSAKELANIEMKALQGNAENPRAYRMERSKLIDAAMEEKNSNKLKLDGEGYSQAMEALREQFPYYIRKVEYLHRNSPGDNSPELREKFESGSDRGYVAPKYLRPVEALEGYYDPTIRGSGMVAGTGKTPAKYTNYANWSNNPIRGASREPEDAKESSPKSAPQGAANLIANAKANASKNAAAKDALREAFKIVDAKMPDDEKAKLAPFRDDADFDAAFSDPTKRQAMHDRLRDMIDRFAAAYPDDPSLSAASAKLSGYKILSESTEEHPFVADEYTLGASPKVPHTFDGPAYEPAAPESIKKAEWANLATGYLAGFKPGELSDDDLRKKASAFGAVASVPEAPDQQELGMLVSQMVGAGIPDERITSIMDAIIRGNSTPMAKGVSRQAKNAALSLERMRRLQMNGAFDVEEAAPALKVAPEKLKRFVAPPGDIISSLNDLGAELEGYGHRNDSRVIDHMLVHLRDVDEITPEIADSVRREFAKFNKDLTKERVRLLLANIGIDV